EPEAPPPLRPRRRQRSPDGGLATRDTLDVEHERAARLVEQRARLAQRAGRALERAPWMVEAVAVGGARPAAEAQRAHAPARLAHLPALAVGRPGAVSAADLDAAQAALARRAVLVALARTVAATVGERAEPPGGALVAGVAQRH